MKKFLLHISEKNLLHTSILLAMLIAGVTVMVGTPSVMAFDPTGTMTLFDAADNDYAVTWVLGSEPGSYPFFDVKLMLTDISDAYAASYSLEYDPTILNFSSHTFGDAFDATGKVPSKWSPTIDYANGWIKEGNNGHMQPDTGSVKTYTDPTWGWVATFTFEFIGATPAVGSPISTLINITNIFPGRTSEWWKLVGGFPDQGAFQTYTSCMFYYETVETLLHVVEGFDVTTVSNTIVSTPILNTIQGELNFNVTGTTGMTGFCNVTIPKGLMAGILGVVVDSALPDSLTITENATHSFVDFTYTLASTLGVTISAEWWIPEFPTLTFLLLLLTFTIAVTILGKKVWAIKRRDNIIAK